MGESRILVVDIRSHASTVKACLQALRPHQWVKNLLIFLPMLLAHQFDTQTTWQSVLAFAAFSLVASSVYVLNDLLDLPSDRAHPRKNKRPFASGRLRVVHGIWLAPLLLSAGFLIALGLGDRFALVMLGYCAATTAYSLYLKRCLVIDICTLAVLYTLRLIAGSFATGIPLSIWLLAFSIFFFFALAALKRQAELVDTAKTGKEKIEGRGYCAGDLPLVANMTISSGYISVLVMALYLNSPAVQKLYTWPSVLWGICLVLLYWVSRMAIITHQGKMHDDPIIFAVRDTVSQICLLTILGFAIGAALL
jgi:4-hydroxybenzoate polyprenyltransferase